MAERIQRRGQVREQPLDGRGVKARPRVQRLEQQLVRLRAGGSPVGVGLAAAPVLLGDVVEPGRRRDDLHVSPHVRRQALGEAHPDTATSYGNVAANLNAQGKYAAAEPLLRKALEIRRQDRFEIQTPKGRLSSARLVFATNAYTHLFPFVRRKQIPAFTYMVATEPLSAQQLEPIGWAGREGIEDARNLIHYYRLTPEYRLVMGGGPVGLTYANDLDADRNEAAWRHLEEHIQFLFPSLKGVKITHRWGGPFSVTVDLTPAMGYVGDQRAVYSVGCIGHGVSASHLNAQTLRDLILERKSDLTESPFVRQRVIPWPPEPLRSLVAYTLRGYLQLEDWYYERELKGS